MCPGGVRGAPRARVLARPVKAQGGPPVASPARTDRGATPTVLVTGGSGLIGQWVVSALRKRGYEVAAPSSAEADLIDPMVADRVVAEVRPTHLVHLAWLVDPGRVWSSPENVDWLAASLRLLRAFARAGGTRAVTVGTCAEYAWTSDDPLHEARTPLRPATLYGAAKLALGDVGCRMPGLELAHARVFFTFGPGEHPDRLVASVARGLLAGKHVSTTAGTQVRDFLAAPEIADALATILATEVRGAVNIGSGEPRAVRDIVSLVADATGRPDLVGFGEIGMRPGEPARLVADVTRLTDEVGWRPAATLPDTLRQAVAWWAERARA